MIYTFVAYVENKPGVLNRVASLFRRRAYNIDSLAVGTTHDDRVSRMTIQVEAKDDDAAKRISANMYKMVDILYVEDVTHKDNVIREMLMIKVSTDNTTRTEIIQIADIFTAEIIDAGIDAMTLLITGTQGKCNRMINMLKQYGIVEMQRTGAVAMLRDSEGVPEGFAQVMTEMGIH